MPHNVAVAFRAYLKGNTGMKLLSDAATHRVTYEGITNFEPLAHVRKWLFLLQLTLPMALQLSQNYLTQIWAPYPSVAWLFLYKPLNTTLSLVGLLMWQICIGQTTFPFLILILNPTRNLSSSTNQMYHLLVISMGIRESSSGPLFSWIAWAEPLLVKARYSMDCVINLLSL